MDVFKTLLSKHAIAAWLAVVNSYFPRFRWMNSANYFIAYRSNYHGRLNISPTENYIFPLPGYRSRPRDTRAQIALIRSFANRLPDRWHSTRSCEIYRPEYCHGLACNRVRIILHDNISRVKDYCYSRDAPAIIYRLRSTSDRLIDSYEQATSPLRFIAARILNRISLCYVINTALRDLQQLDRLSDRLYCNQISRRTKARLATR